MTINQIKITGVAGIHELELNFNEGMNILCGPNGVGKTSILESLAHIFVRNFGSTVIKRNVTYEKGIITAKIDNNGNEIEQVLEFDTYLPNVTSHASSKNSTLDSKELISIKTLRTFGYQELSSISKDAQKDLSSLITDAVNGIKYQDIKNWFVNRYLYSKHENSLSNEQIQNFELAKTCLSMLNPDFSFSRVSASDNEILINTPNGEIFYEYLSSGFKSVFAVLFGIIKEIEYRFKEKKIIAKDFDGIILIDEIELHLHPEWQEKIIIILGAVFPKAQFFVTTHSPHVIQSAEPKQIIALGFDESNKVYQRALPSSKYGFKGWTIEEVLSDVMGMNNLRTNLFTDILAKFDHAIDNEDINNAELIYQEINDMLHPQNELRKLLKFQLIGIK